MRKTIQLTDQFHVESPSHILYFYEEEQQYIQNLLAYVYEGVKRGDDLLVIENFRITDKVKRILKMKLTPKEHKCIRFVNNQTFYGSGKSHHINDILSSFEEQLESFHNAERNIRTWGHVEWRTNEGLKDDIIQFEKKADCTVRKAGIVSVCAYAAREISASLQNMMMYTHEYIMTDKELAKSSFYRSTSV